MKRTAKKKGISTYSDLTGSLATRLALATRLGFQYGGARNIYQALGYPQELTYQDFYSHYTRQDIAAAIIDRPIKATWRGDVDIVDAEEEETTALEKAWDELYTDLSLKSKFVRLDKLTSLGRYGVLFLGFSDANNKEMFQQPVTKSNNLKLSYVKPFGETNASIQKYETDVTNKRYGLPLMYELTVTAASSDSTGTLVVHHSRILHVTIDLLDSEVIGIPVLQKVFNRLLDLEKIVGGSGEMYWRGARPGYQGKVDEEYEMTDAMMTSLEEQLDEYENNLRRILVNEGLELKALETQVSDPSKHVDVQIQMISAVTGIPKRILTGSERGELSSTQDLEAWLSLIQDRREEFVNLSIIRPFIDRCIEFGVLPESTEGKYTIQWTDLFAVSDKDKADIGKIRSEAFKNYTANPLADQVLPPEIFLRYLLGLKDEDVVKILEAQEVFMNDMALEEQNDGDDEDEEEIEVVRTR